MALDPASTRRDLASIAMRGTMTFSGWPKLDSISRLSSFRGGLRLDRGPNPESGF
jgi:hypothetical protein